MRRAWLAIDPGIATGWAVLGDDGEVMATSVWGTAELESSLDLLVRRVFSAGYAVHAVVEQMPAAGRSGPLARKLEAVRQTIRKVLVDTYEIRVTHVTPGEWKPSRVAKTAPQVWKWEGESTTIHQRDAIRMGRYVIDRETRKENQ